VGRKLMVWKSCKIHLATVIAVMTLIGSLVATPALVANGLGSAKPTLLEDKFDVPADQLVVTQEWVSRGFTEPTLKVYPRDWSKGEHAHPYSLLITPIAGRMEFIIADQRVVIEPGDELYYPGRAVMLARNLHAGESKVLISQRP